jgi:Nucleotidyltransferase substrate binding protein like
VVTRACFQSALLTDEQGRVALEMARDRNLTVHTYNEELANQIYSRLSGYADLMDFWLAAMSDKAA